MYLSMSMSGKENLQLAQTARCQLFSRRTTLCLHLPKVSVGQPLMPGERGGEGEGEGESGGQGEGREEGRKGGKGRRGSESDCKEEFKIKEERRREKEMDRWMVLREHYLSYAHREL